MAHTHPAEDGEVDLPRRGLADLPPDELGREVLSAWDAFLALVTDPRTDLTRPSRLRGWRGLDTCVHLGSWPDAQVLDALLVSARTGGGGAPVDADAGNAALVAAHAHESPERVVQALRDARDRLADFFASADAVELGRAPTRSAVGRLPLLGLVHAGCYELAVHALDLAPCGAPPPAEHLLQRGLAALLDVTGALAAGAGVELVLTGATPTGGWQFDSGPHGWATRPVAPGRLDGTGVRGTATDLLDTSAGRVGLPQMLLTRRLQVQQLQHFMRLAPLLEEVPGLPGGPALKNAVAGMSGVSSGLGRVLGRLPRFR